MKRSAENLSPFRALPSVDAVLRQLGELDLPRPIVVDLVRRELQLLRGSTNQAPRQEDVIARIKDSLRQLRLTRIQPIINATGIIIHTNFGRSPLAAKAIDALGQIASGYCNLEFDLASGERGGRAAYLEQALALLCESESATVVNNCAAALVLTLRHFAAQPPRNEVVISRGELVQIGGGFRIPEILEAAGAVLREVGTTNCTTIDDYRRAIDPQRTALILRVHQSNFYMDGFVESASRSQLSALARRNGIPFVEDLGSGAIFDSAPSDSAGREPTPAQSIAGGADIVTFSGDKLLGGPQAGILAGTRDHISALKRNPFFRALRCDKLILTSLQITIEQLLAGKASTIPIHSMMQIPLEELRCRAQEIQLALKGGALQSSIVDSVAQVGGGCLPRLTIPSISIEVRTKPMELAEHLRIGYPAIVGRLSNGALQLDLRTVFPHEDRQLINALKNFA